VAEFGWKAEHVKLLKSYYLQFFFNFSFGGFGETAARQLPSLVRPCPGKCILLVINKQRIANTRNVRHSMVHYRIYKSLLKSPILSHTGWLHTLPHYFFKIRFTIILPSVPRYSYLSPSFRFLTNDLHAFLPCPSVLLAPPKTPNATDFCQTNLRKTEGAKLLDQLTLCLFAGDVYQTVPAVRRLQKGSGCRSPGLHRVRH
jgi:hypothetical protein